MRFSLSFCHAEYKRGVIDPTLFRKKNGNHLMVVQIYVDDIIFWVNRPGYGESI